MKMSDTAISVPFFYNMSALGASRDCQASTVEIGWPHADIPPPPAGEVMRYLEPLLRCDLSFKHEDERVRESMKPAWLLLPSVAS